MVAIAVIDYGAGNLHSVCAGLKRVMQPRDSLVLAPGPEALAHASHIVLPGVGAFGDCAGALARIDGLSEALARHALSLGKPFLGICVGMQLLFTRGHEHGITSGLGWLPGEVVALPRPMPGPVTPHSKIPHMGWNTLTLEQPHPLLHGIRAGDHAYFIHSYHARPRKDAHRLACSTYGQPFATVVGRDNVVGTQFHPEKSGELGARILENFCHMR